MAKKLHYYHLNGLAEFTRYMLHYAGEEFEDIRHVHSEFVKNGRENAPYGQLPVYEENGQFLNQSIAIARYVASKSDLLPSDPWQQAILDAAALTIFEFWLKAYPYGYEEDPVKKAALKKKNFEELIPFYFSRFEKELKAGNGHFCGKLSWADFVLVGISDTANLFYDGEFYGILERDYPTIYALITKVNNLPRIKEYIAARKPYVMPWN